MSSAEVGYRGELEEGSIVSSCLGVAIASVCSQQASDGRPGAAMDQQGLQCGRTARHGTEESKDPTGHLTSSQRPAERNGSCFTHSCIPHLV